MPYKIRNQGLWGLGKSVDYRMHDTLKRKPIIHMENLVAYQGQLTTYAEMIIKHNYRNISRAAKQFLMGDTIREQNFIVTLKNFYKIPSYYKSPIFKLYHFKRGLGELLDRHYALFSHNIHPVQLLLYENNNKAVQNSNDVGYQENLECINKRIQELSKEKMRKINVEEGETLTIDDFEECFMKAMEEYRSREPFKSRTKDKDGEINDSLELRRPFPSSK